MVDTTESDDGNYQYSDEELLQAIRDVAKRHGEVTIDLYNQEEGVPASSVIIDRFDDPDADEGGWVRAKKAAGVGGDGRANNSRPREYTNAEMIEMLQTCAERYESCSQKWFDYDDEFCSSGAVVKRFGKWSQAKKEAGVE